MPAPRPELETLIDEVRLLWNTLVRRGESLHRGREAVTLGMRAVLEFLRRSGPASVPAIARSRGVSRQHIQVLVNPLRDARLVEAAPNPAHRRSPLIRLTAKGERTIDRMRRREASVLGAVPAATADLRHAAATLRALRRSLEREGEPRRRARAGAAVPRSTRPAGTRPRG